MWWVEGWGESKYTATSMYYILAPDLALRAGQLGLSISATTLCTHGYASLFV
jgi:hypothetical protein